MEKGVGLMPDFAPTSETQIAYDPDADAFYIRPHCDTMFPAVLPRTEVLCESPFIAVDIISDTVVGIEILPGGKRDPDADQRASH
jgi:uncharacterized protein YuzE